MNQLIMLVILSSTRIKIFVLARSTDKFPYIRLHLEILHLEISRRIIVFLQEIFSQSYRNTLFTWSN